MIYWVYNNVKNCAFVQEVIVLTDDTRVEEACGLFGGKVLMTGSYHENGTSRIGEILTQLDADIIINVQGDEPLTSEIHLKSLVKCFENPGVKIATLSRKIEKPEELFDYHKVKVVFDQSGKALYFSRQAIPGHRDIPYREWLGQADYYLHIGMYAFRKEVLRELVKLKQGQLEKAEKLEQLRWLESGYPIQVGLVESSESFGVDTPEDLDRMRRLLRKD